MNRHATPDTDTPIAPGSAALAALLTNPSATVETMALGQLLDAAQRGVGRVSLRSLCKATGLPPHDIEVLTANSPWLIREDRHLMLPRYAQFLAEVRHFFATRLASVSPCNADAAALQSGINAICPPAIGFDDGDQRRAIFGLAQASAGILSGGPGTGKTTTAAALLALRSRLDPTLTEEDILIAAPTGKAAQRLQNAMRKAAERLQLSPRERTLLLALRPLTLHTALGWIPLPPEQGGPFRHQALHPLPHRIVLVDEVSMVDLALMARLLRALSPGTQLLLLGDHDQLESVEVGGVLQELLADTSLRSAIHTLCANYRAKDAPDIMAWADMTRPGSKASIHDLLIRTQDAKAQVHWVATPIGQPLRDPIFLQVCTSAWQAWHRHFADLKDTDAPAAIRTALAALGDFQLLTATNADREKANALGLTLFGSDPESTRMPHGAPVLVLANDRPLDLSNGDVGLALGAGPGQMARSVFFPGRDTPVLLADMPPHAPAFGLTIHKSQGSEWRHVAIALPDLNAGSPLLTRNLLYTAITRASHRVTLAGSPEGLEQVMR